MQEAVDTVAAHGSIGAGRRSLGMEKNTFDYRYQKAKTLGFQPKPRAKEAQIDAPPAKPSIRHMIIPDTQVKPGVDTTHIDWAARAAIEYRPDVIVIIGDWWDMPSLSQHDAPGSKEAEGRRVKPDIDAGNEAFVRFSAPIKAERARIKKTKEKPWNPRCEFLFGNHEHRLTRAIFREPKWDGILNLDALKTPGFNRNDFLKIVEIDGIKYCHYFASPHSGRAIGGTIPNRLNHIGGSFVQGHMQGFLYGSKQYPDHVAHGLVAGRFYSHHESYRTQDVQRSEWSGIVVLNQVEAGNFDLMPLSFNYLRSKFA